MVRITSIEAKMGRARLNGQSIIEYLIILVIVGLVSWAYRLQAMNLFENYKNTAINELTSVNY